MKQSLKIVASAFSLLIVLGSMITVQLFGQDSKNNPEVLARFEHVAINIPDPPAAAKWYCEHLGMKIMRAGDAPTFTTFIADSGAHMMLELFHNDAYPLLEPAKIHFTSMHFAFVTPDITTTLDELLKAGATIADSLRTTSSGDRVLVLRDPWGFAIQFVQRAKTMLGFAGLYPEHFALNSVDARAKAKWLCDHMSMIIMRQGGAPSYGTFVADAGKHMMFELYQNPSAPVVDFSKVSHMSLHVAFMVDDVQAAKEALIKVGATLVDDVTTTPAGDQVLMLRDPDGLPIQFVKRATPMLK